MFGCPGILPILVLAITSSLCWAKNEPDPSSPVDLGGKWKRFCLDKTGNKFRQGRYFSLGCYKYTCVKGRRRTKIWKKTVLKAECCVSGASVFEHGEIVSNTTSKENCTREVDICRVEHKIPLVQTSYYYGECCKFNGKRFEIGVEIPFENDCFRLKCKMGDHGPEIVSAGLEASTIQATVTDAITETTAATVTDAITGTTKATITDAITEATAATITDAIAETPTKITTSVSTTTENEPSHSTLSLTIEASTITESSSKCITIKGKECIFPFIDGGKSYETCKKYGKDYWCATSLTSSGKWKTWEYCDTTVCPLFGIPFNPTTTKPQTTKTATTESKPAKLTTSTMETSTIGESSSQCITIKGTKCTFPFIDGSKSYSSCKKYGDKYWCATSLTSSGKWNSWEYCDTTVCPLFGIPFNPPTTTQTQITSKTVSTTTENGPAKLTTSGMETSTITASSSKCITIKGKECIFPFTDGGQSYNSCKKYGKKYWCATSLTSSGKWNTWEYCDITVCPLFGIPFNPTTTQMQTSTSKGDSTTKSTMTSNILLSTDLITKPLTTTTIVSSLVTETQNETDEHFYIVNLPTFSVLDVSEEGNVIMGNKTSTRLTQQWKNESGILINKQSGLALHIQQHTCCNLILTKITTECLSTWTFLENNIINVETNRLLETDGLFVSLSFAPTRGLTNQIWGLRSSKPTKCEELFEKSEDTTAFSEFEHLKQDPECWDDIEPKFRLFTKDDDCTIVDAKTDLFNLKSCSALDKLKSMSNLRKIVFVIHGFMANADDWPKKMADLIIQNEENNDVAVVTVDWKKGAAPSMPGISIIPIPFPLTFIPDIDPIYGQAAANTRYMGLATARVVQQLHEIKPSSKIHCIGHSLGAHTCGFAGKETAIDRISGMDPAGPKFKKSKAQERLDKSDGGLLDILHTDGDKLGLMKPIGDTDFYSGKNDKTYGSDQSGCLTFFCDHSRSHEIYRSTIVNKGMCRVQVKCKKYTEGIFSKETLKECEEWNEEPVFGYWYEGGYNGLYGFIAKEEYPYCEKKIPSTNTCPTCISEEEPLCRAEKGYCGQKGKCPNGNYIDDKCPWEGNDVKCCKSMPFQEPECEAKGGTCMDDCGCKGETFINLCPNQPDEIKCCVQAKSRKTCEGCDCCWDWWDNLVDSFTPPDWWEDFYGWFEGDPNYTGSGWGHGIRTKILNTLGFDDKVENVFEAGILSMLQASEVTLTGQAVEKLKLDPGLLKREEELLDEIKSQTKFCTENFEIIDSKLIGFGGKRTPGSMWEQAKDPFNSKYRDTWKVAANELTWLVRNTVVTSKITITNKGEVSMDHSFSDIFDLRPTRKGSSEDASAYNTITRVLGALYHDVAGGNDEMRVKANWKNKFDLDCDTETCTSETDERCSSVGGYCMEKTACPESNFVDNKCPGGNNIKCCLAAPFQESQCEEAEGACMDECKCLEDSEAKVGFCPSQPGPIKCCVKDEIVDECPGTTVAPTVEPACFENRQIRASGCTSEPSEQCATEGGYCGNPDNCPDNNVVHNKCPGGNNNKCCLSIPFQEPECEAEGGTCVDKCGCEGEVLHGFCPSQPNSVKCCKGAVSTASPSSTSGTTTKCPPIETTTISVSITTDCINNRMIRSSGCSSEPSEQCADEGGYCGNPDNCPDNNVVHNKCPGGNNNKCCLSIPFQEPECEAEGGTCVDKCGCEGEVLHGFCPSQPNSVKCCKTTGTTPAPSGTTDALSGTTAAAIEACATEATTAAATTPLNCPGGYNSNCNNGVCTVTCSGGGNNNNNNNGGGGGSGGGAGGSGGGEKPNCPGGSNTNCNNGVCVVTCSGGGGNNNNNNNNNGRRRRKRSSGEVCPGSTAGVTSTPTITTSTQTETKTILVTGFGKFGDHCLDKTVAFKGEKNPSQLVAEKLPSVIDGYTIKRAIIDVEYDKIDQKLPELWKKENPVFIVSLGMASNARHIQIETKADNYGFGGLDVAGNLPANAPYCIPKNALLASLTSKFDLPYACDKAHENVGCEKHDFGEDKICILDDKDAGQYLCEYMYYTTLHGYDRKSVFLHLPHPTCQNGNDKSHEGMTIDHITEAVEEIIKELIKQEQKW